MSLFQNFIFIASFQFSLRKYNAHVNKYKKLYLVGVIFNKVFQPVHNEEMPFVIVISNVSSMYPSLAIY